MSLRYELWEVDEKSGDTRTGSRAGYRQLATAYRQAEAIARRERVTVGIGLFEVADGDRTCVEVIDFISPPSA